jgi:hypothetical protein|tara:strand:+ start:768 stop:1469 length:702 start_codon:yes stop_codon:yes gene_type:complete
MSYQDELKKFFNQRAESFKKEDISLYMDRKMDFTYAHIECNFESLPKDAKWIEVDDDHYWNSRYESESGIGEYDFKGKVNLYFVDFKSDFSHFDKEDREKYLRYLYGTEEDYDELADWSSDADDNYIRNYFPVHYQFAYGEFSIGDDSFNDYLILKSEIEYDEPWNGRTNEINYEGVEIFHPTENKFVPVILSTNGMFVSECAALDVVFKNNDSLPWIEIERIKDYVSRLTQA